MSEDAIKATAATETAAEQKTQQSETKTAAEPAFYKWQLKAAGVLNAQVDVIETLLKDDMQYTVAEATKIIDEFMNKEVK